MKKVQVFVGIVMITMIMSCGGSYCQIVKGTNSDTSQQRIVKTEEKGKDGDIDINIFDYDEQGRLTRVLETVQLPEMDLDLDGGSMLRHITPWGHRGTVCPEETRGERLVPDKIPNATQG